MHARLTGTLLVLVVVSLITMQPSARPVQAGFTLIGLVDGGKPSGSSLTPDGTLTIVSDDSGAPVRYVVSLAWFKDQIPDLSQDDLLSVEVEVLPDGSLVALNVTNLTSRQGTANQGRSTGSQHAAEQPRARSEDDQSNEGAATPTLTPSPTSTSTPTVTLTVGAGATHASTPTATVTVTIAATNTPSPSTTPSPTSTPTGTSTATATPSSTATATLTSTTTSTATSTATATTTSTPTVISTPTGTATSTLTITPTSSATTTATATVTDTPTNTPTPTQTATATPTSTPTQTITPTPLPTNVTVTLDADGDVGQFTSLQLDANGNPVISYYDLTNGDLKLAICGNTTCSAGNTIRAVDTGGNVGRFSSLQLNASGHPVVSYQDGNPGGLKIVVCGDATCASGNTFQAVDPTATNTGFGSLRLNASGNPVISYKDNDPNYDLKLVVCGNATCSAGNTFQSPDTLDDVGDSTSLRLNAAGNPVVSYYDVTNGNLKLIVCGNATCSSGNTVRTLDTPSLVGLHTSLQLDASGNPVISYFDITNRDLKIVVCGDATCASNNVIQTLDSTGVVGQSTSLQLNASGNPVISYEDRTGQVLKLIVCGDPTCSSGNIIRELTSTGVVGQFTSLQLDANGNPVVSFYDGNAHDLKVVICANPTCAP